MKQINPRHIAELIPVINNSPFSSLLALEITDMGYGYCNMEVRLDKQLHSNAVGALHGAVYASAIEVATYWAVYCAAPENSGLVALDLHVDDLATTADDRILIAAKMKKSGKTIFLSEATITDTTGKQLAYGTSKQMVTTNAKTIHQAILSAGNEPLPPKYLD
jgi:uncharacterized protein (TIGR00369 family)